MTAARSRAALIRALTQILSLLVLCALLNLHASENTLTTARELYAAERWSEIVALWRSEPDPAADLDYYAGMAFARLKRWDEAAQALAAGQRKAPVDKRFPVELGGLAFARKDFREATKNLVRALRLDRSDRYTIDLLASVYFLENNLEGALEYWNRIGKPYIEQIRMEPVPPLDPVLLDGAFAVAPAGKLELHDLWRTEALLAQLDVFSRYRLDLVARDEDQKFDLVFRSAEQGGWGNSKAATLISWLRGLPYETIYPESYNLGRSAVNFTSLFRFDPQKRRAFAALSMPLEANPALRIRFYVDGRIENWDLRTTYHGAAAQLSDLRLNKLEGGIDFRSVINDAWSWSTAVALSDRTFARFTAPSSAQPFTNGIGLKYRAQLDHPLLRIPLKRVTIISSVSGEFGKLFARGFDAFSRIQGAVTGRWTPGSQVDKYQISGGLRAGKTFGMVPLDELFILGLERDNDLPLRAHIGTHEGRKGSAPLGRDYVLFNSEADRSIYNSTLLQFRIGPFFDSGRITDATGSFGARKWQMDTGVQLKVRTLGGVNVVFSYGKDLRGGANAFYVTTSH